MQRRLCVTLVVLAAAASVPAPGASGQTAWAPVPPADLAKLKPADFADDELDLPYYLAHFHRVANSVVVSVSFDESAVAEAVPRGLSVGPRRVVTLLLRARDRLTYRLGFSAR